jgi:dTDP-4-dehydrorhamnose 3,5-epimerase
LSFNFKIGEIEGVLIKNLNRFEDHRGWLAEVFRRDEISEEIYPAMAYISLTLPNIIRGPHEHLKQTDYFCFINSNFKLVLWDNREESKTYMNKMILYISERELKIVIIPPRIVHAYKNIGSKPGLVLNFPNRLYAGWGRKEKVDEVRYENDPNTIFKVDEE